MNPFFSILVVSLNAEATIGATIDSVLQQTFDDYEIVIKDGMSCDHTLSSFRESEKIRVYQQPDSGIYDAMNQAVALAKGRYLLFLNCGDFLYDSTVLQKVYEVAKDLPERAVVYGDYCRKGIVFQQPSQLSDFYLFRTPLCHQSMFFSATLFQDHLYHTDYKILADYDHTLCDRQSGATFCHIAYPICDYMGCGVSEQPAGKIKKEEEYGRIRKQYYSDAQIRRYQLLRKLSLVKLRGYVISDRSPKWVRRMYRTLVNFVNR